MNIETLQADLDEFKATHLAAKSARLRDLLASNIAKMEAELKVLAVDARAATVGGSPGVTATAAAATTAASAKVPTPATMSGAQFKVIERYGWDETSKHVKLYITLDGVGLLTDDEVELSGTSDSMTFRVLRPPPHALALHLSPFKKEIDPQRLAVKLKKDQAVITVVKRAEGKWWDLLEKSSGFASGSKSATASSRSKDADEMDSADPSKSLMDMMKKLYDEGDDEMKRTIGKAWTESREKQLRGESL